MGKVVKVLVDSEWVYVKKGLLNWRIIHPIKTESGKINWKHLIAGGSWWNLAIVGTLTLLAIFVIQEYVSNIAYLQKQLEWCTFTIIP